MNMHADVEEPVLTEIPPLCMQGPWDEGQSHNVRSDES